VESSTEKNDNWTRPWGEYLWLSDPDLGELEVPEPPLFYQAEPEEIDTFMESSVHTTSKIADETEHDSDAVSARPSLVGPWSGSYEYRRGQQIDGLVSFSITEQQDDGTFEGSGVDVVGAFTVAGTITGSKVNFIKSYTTSTTSWSWKYIGVLDTEMTGIVGRWGPPDMEDEVAPISAVEGSGPFNQPGETTGRGSAEDGAEDGESSDQAPPCDLKIIVEGPNDTSGKETEKEEVGDLDRASEAGSAHSGTQTDVTDIFQGGTFSLVRRPIDYFLYRPSDADFQESRPKALWKMVRNAASQWYRSRHLTWDALRERRDKRNRYTELLLKQREMGNLYDPNEAAEWSMIVQQTHPNDLHLWRTIARYKQNRTVRHSYVSQIPYLWSSEHQTNASGLLDLKSLGALDATTVETASVAAA
jgi:hypothetical protein